MSIGFHSGSVAPFCWGNAARPANFLRRDAFARHFRAVQGSGDFSMIAAEITFASFLGYQRVLLSCPEDDAIAGHRRELADDLQYGLFERVIGAKKSARENALERLAAVCEERLLGIGVSLSQDRAPQFPFGRNHRRVVPDGAICLH